MIRQGRDERGRVVVGEWIFDGDRLHGAAGLERAGVELQHAAA